MYITDDFERMSHLPIVTKRFGKNKKEPDDFASMTDTASDNIEIKDFSDDIDVDGLGSLLSGGMSSVGGSDFDVDFKQPLEPKKSKNFAENIGKFIKSLADKIGDKNTNKDIPDLPDADDKSADPNYVSETVSFVDFPDEQQEQQFGADNIEPSLPDYPPRDSGAQEMRDDDFGFSPELHSDFRRDENMYMSQEAQEIPSFGENYSNDFAGYPQTPTDFGQNAAQYQPYNADMMNTDVQYQPYSSDVLNIESDYASFSQSSENSDERGTEETASYEDDEQPVRRPHDIMGAVKARIEQFRRRLPSFKPKQYTIPEVSYDETQDNLIKSPTLAADIEKIIRRQSDLGEVSREYEEMRQYIRSVDENARLPRHEITPPENIHEVYSAQNELFEMIYQIGAENEQQRSRIGVYERPEEEDPYNYRGINDERQNYTDIEFASFSMSPSMDFESENKVSVERMMWERQQNQVQSMDDISADDGFESDFDDDFFGMEENEPKQNFSPDFDNDPYSGQIIDDGFDDDLTFDDDMTFGENMPLDDSFGDNSANDEREGKGLFGMKFNMKPRRR